MENKFEHPSAQMQIKEEENQPITVIILGELIDKLRVTTLTLVTCATPVIMVTCATPRKVMVTLMPFLRNFLIKR
jgi:hypothetical protein